MTSRLPLAHAQALRCALTAFFASVLLAALSACGGSATATPSAATATTVAGVAQTPTSIAVSAASGSAATATRPVATTASTPTGGSAITAASTATVVVTQAASPTGSASAATATVRKVNANTASQAELLQAFQAAGIPNAAQWVREVMEYRPYPTNDPSFAKLRGELAKYNPSPEVVDMIIATLSL